MSISADWLWIHRITGHGYEDEECNCTLCDAVAAEVRARRLAQDALAKAEADRVIAVRAEAVMAKQVQGMTHTLATSERNAAAMREAILATTCLDKLNDPTHKSFSCLVETPFNLCAVCALAKVASSSDAGRSLVPREEVERVMLGMEIAWGVIANAGPPNRLGDWDALHPEWKQAAERWRDEHWHPALARLKEGK